MNLLLLCGYLEKQHEAEVASRSHLEQAANLYQRRLIEGLRGQPCHLRVVSAPFIGVWPKLSSQRVFRGFAVPSQEDVTYVPFHNLWGYRSISRMQALRKPVDDFLKETPGTERAIVIYAPHTPFLHAAVRAKRKAPDLRICLIVPDLPQYMNLNTGSRRFYDFCKYFDIRLFEKRNRQVDAYLLIARPMADALHVGQRPYFVAEGLADEHSIQQPGTRSKTFVYAGKLVRRFGVKRMLEAFSLLDDPEFRLVICGDGEMRTAVEAAAQKDQRIRYLGMLPHSQLKAVLRGAGVLVNPRTGEEAYTRYSFPSKIIEYLQTGLPVVSACLDGMPDVYRQLLYCPADDSAAALAQAMQWAMEADPAEEKARVQLTQAHLRTLAPSVVAGRLLSMIKGKAAYDGC